MPPLGDTARCFDEKEFAGVFHIESDESLQAFGCQPEVGAIAASAVLAAPLVLLWHRHLACRRC